MIRISSDAGRIGPLWWFNTVPTPVPSERLFDGVVQGRRFIRWGTVGVGVTARLSYEEAP